MKIGYIFCVEMVKCSFLVSFFFVSELFLKYFFINFLLFLVVVFIRLLCSFCVCFMNFVGIFCFFGFLLFFGKIYIVICKVFIILLKLDFLLVGNWIGMIFLLNFFCVCLSVDL